MTKWTKLEKTRAWTHAQKAYGEPARSYHNMVHIKRMYEWAHFFNYEYDANLDWAILLHDFHQSGDHPVLASAMQLVDFMQEESGTSIQELPDQFFLYGQVINPVKVQDLIMSTATHITAGQEDLRLIELDLMDLIDSYLRVQNRKAVIKELKHYHSHMTEEQLTSINKQFMMELRNRLLTDPSSKIIKIVEGIEALYKLPEMPKPTPRV